VFSENDFVASENLNYLQTPQKFLNQPVEDFKKKRDVTAKLEEQEGGNESKRAEYSQKGISDGPGTNTNVLAHVN
jgi:hypothetical protein